MRSFAIFVLCTFLLCGSIWAQNESASLSGTIADTSGASVARASARLVNGETGESYQAVSNDNGDYDFPLVKPGHYSLTAELTGFKQFVQSGIILVTGVPLRVDVKLEVGALTEKVTVEM